jgi:hypothetical protein
VRGAGGQSWQHGWLAPNDNGVAVAALPNRKTLPGERGWAAAHNAGGGQANIVAITRAAGYGHIFAGQDRTFGPRRGGVNWA